MLISLIIPMLNEAKNLPSLCERLEKNLPSKFTYEYVFIDDGSTDDSVKVAQGLKTKQKLQVIEFSRNFGKESAIYAGLKSCKGDAAVIIDADLQHPPELIKTFVTKWQAGADMVYGVLDARKHQGFFRKWFSNRFYQMLNLLSETHIPQNAGDFRLLNRKVIDAIISCPERSLFMKGLYAWVGFNTCAVPYQPNDRADGKKGRWSFGSLFNLAIAGVTSFSSIPLRIATLVGLFISIFAFIYGVYIIASTLVYGTSTPGFATIMVVILFLGGIQLIAIGIVGEYIAKIFNEVKVRPRYIVADRYDNKSK